METEASIKDSLGVGEAKPEKQPRVSRPSPQRAQSSLWFRKWMSRLTCKINISGLYRVM